ncbi:MAG: hypothetical protein A2785_04165 [Candidatus Chisholmbacteria bacterium RIFCSPHIGHO2_01_FULL_49_18]|uniref:Uncharacterized protein n=2 Tax=Candidatus Chisholmiibacteriota TaxID=1817900 RepID=A0A1G1VP99_9BACT|nr:MAG: hypothetical protein A2785_04165 [Candidatus Chisholmbacteria bacterium RIFCSPHIGHO2_01_FULL_49_18]OGY22519.1 MAG: hypothetical protein A3A65_00830 [Candidatus Chisholmbacteria bacterium RIFCSPLOWO2_01_FULL_49_14]
MGKTSKEQRFKGTLAAETVEVRFAFSGKVVQVAKKPGDRVSRGTLLASLDTKVLQMELDRELSDYERTRADFEIYGIRSKDQQSDLTKYEQTRVQALLNASVKAVELVKYRMDQARLYSPVDGVILTDGGMRAGLFVTPGSYGFEILDRETIHLALEIEWEKTGKFTEGAEVALDIAGKEPMKGTILPLMPHAKKDVCLVRVKPQAPDGLWPGMKGEVLIGSDEKPSV